MLKGKVLNAYRDGHTTYVTKQTKYGTFHGKVTCTPEDYDIETDIDGYIFAEIKCDIQSFKVKANYLKQRELGVRHAYNVLLKSGLDENDKTMKKLARQLKIAEREATIAEGTFREVRDHFVDFVETAQRARRKVKQMKI